MLFEQQQHVKPSFNKAASKNQQYTVVINSVLCNFKHSNLCNKKYKDYYLKY